MKPTDAIVKAIKNEPTISKHIDRNHWISGSSTVVYPIMISESHVDVQMDTDRNYFNGAIKRVTENHKDMFSAGYFCKGDGSRPSVLRFVLLKNNN